MFEESGSPSREELLQKIAELEKQVEKDRVLHGEQLHLFSGIFENSIEGIVVTDARGTIRMVNPGFTAISGYCGQEAIGQNPRILKSGRHGRDFYKAMWKALREEGRWQGEIWNRNKNGKAYVERLSISAIRDPRGKITHYVGVFHDISDIKRREEKYKYWALHDPLTGLPNRQLLEDRLERAIAAARRHKKKVGVLFIDLDGFKSVNDNHGHQVGDMYLQEVALRLKASSRDEDTVSRTGGDEFIMLLPDLPEGPADAKAGAQRIVQAFEEPAIIDQKPFKILASIGIAVYPESGSDVAQLVFAADAAMYQAKQQKGTCFVLHGQ